MLITLKNCRSLNSANYLAFSAKSLAENAENIKFTLTLLDSFFYLFLTQLTPLVPIAGLKFCPQGRMFEKGGGGGVVVDGRSNRNFTFAGFETPSKL